MALQAQNPLTPQNRVNFQSNLAPQNRVTFQDNLAPQNAGLAPQTAGLVPQQNPSLVPQGTAPVPQNTFAPQSALAPQSAYAPQTLAAQSALVHPNKPPGTVLGRGGDNYRDNYRTAGPTQLGRDRRQYSAPSDDNTLSNQILITDRSHERPYDVLLLSVKQVLQTIEAILVRANKPVDIHGTVVPGVLVPATAQVDSLEHERAIHASLSALHDNLDVPNSVLNEISCEIQYKSLSGVDANKTTMDILERVQHYDWDEKVVLALASFAIKDGEFWLVAQLFTSNPLAKAIGQLKQMQEILERSGTSLKAKFEVYNNLVNAVLKVTRIIVHLQDIYHDPHLATEIKATTPTNHIPSAVYWTIRSIVILASQLLGITGSDPEYVTEAWELSSLAHKLESIYKHLEDNLNRLHELTRKYRDEEAFAAIERILESPHIDNSKPLRVLFYKDDQPALFDGYNKKRVDIDVLRRKVVILMISDLDIGQENEYIIAHQMYSEKRQFPTRAESQYEIVWVPIVDNWTEAKLLQFEEIRNGMEWYSVYHPSFVSPIVVKYIKDKRKWNFVKKPLLVVMDPQGKIVHTNAVHMMCVFGSAAYPFTSNRERLLWEEETWRIELLADAIDQTLLNWIAERKYICLYGGEDINWIRNFTRTAKNVALEAGIQLELLYLGKSKQKERVVKEIIRVIKEEKLSHTIDSNLIWFFWVRLESMWQSKGQLMSELSKANFTDHNIKNDIIMQGIVSLLSFGSTDRGWALIALPSSEMAKANGEHMSKSLNDFKIWKPKHDEVGFTPALNEYLSGVYRDAPHHCTNLILPATGIMPETVSCSECGRIMERYAMFRCCTD
ncbi:hypothetical protein ACLB2K_034328 [Fragaria x ananassa]